LTLTSASHDIWLPSRAKEKDRFSPGVKNSRTIPGKQKEVEGVALQIESESLAIEHMVRGAMHGLRGEK
jgi:hypothetical protein